MMADAPEFDAMALRADTSLGLFVVARLASKLGITVTFDPSRYGGTRATVLIPTHHLAGERHSAPVASAEFRSGILDTSELEPAGSAARHAVDENPPDVAAPAGRDAKPRPYPARALAPSPAPRLEPADGNGVAGGTASTNGEDRPKPKLPRREPQQNLVSQLQHEPDEDGDVFAGEETAHTLTAFARGTRRGRDGSGDS
jgi:hypothetical protein